MKRNGLESWGGSAFINAHASSDDEDWMDDADEEYDEDLDD